MCFCTDSFHLMPGSLKNSTVSFKNHYWYRNIQENKKLSCRRERARRFPSSLSNSRSLKVIWNNTGAFHSNHGRIFNHLWDIQRQRMAPFDRPYDFLLIRHWELCIKIHANDIKRYNTLTWIFIYGAFYGFWLFATFGCCLVLPMLEHHALASMMVEYSIDDWDQTYHFVQKVR